MKYIGQPIRRKEDFRLVCGRGTFVDDVVLPNTAFAAFVRSQHAHARILGIDSRAARAMPGVLAVLTAKDWAAAGMGELRVRHHMFFTDGRPSNTALRPVFAADRVRHVGDAVAVVIAESRDAAEDAADAVEVGYEALPACVALRACLDPGPPLLP